MTVLRSLVLSTGVFLPHLAWGADPVTQSLFDGRSLNGWEGNPARWRVADGAIIGEIPAGDTLNNNEFLFWKGEVADFELTLEYRITGGPTANSGIQFRAQRRPDGHAAGYQADLDDGAVWLGRIYDEEGRALIMKRGTRVSISPDGRRWSDPFAAADSFRGVPAKDGWNRYRIVATSSHVAVWINDVFFGALDDHRSDAAEYSGRLAVQLHAGTGPLKIQIRKVLLTSLGKSQLPAGHQSDPAKKPDAPNAPAVRAAGAGGGDRQTTSPVLWHLRSNPAKPNSIGSEDARKTVAGMMLTAGFQAELIASEPEVRQPIAFAIDEKGRLWVLEGFSYPNKQPEGQGRDRVIILADTDGDGAFETRTVFTEGLNLASGIEVGFGGVWIGAAPQLLFIPDRNHDDTPDGPPEILLDGWGYQDTHETLNSFTWGPDGWLYGHQGVFTSSSVGKPGTPENQRVPLHSAVWRYHPVRHEFELFAHGGSNQWGLDYNEAGHLFMTHCRSFHGGGGTTHIIRNGHFWNQANGNYGPFISSEGPDFAPELRNYLPAAAKYDSGEGGAGKPGTTAIYGGHSHVGTMIYQGENWPAIYRDHLFTHNLHGHQVNHQINVRQGSGYETMHAGADLLFAPDPRYIPVDLQTGPDGAVYVIDWCDQQHCHTPIEEKWDRTNGRIYRISWAATYRPAKVDLSNQTSLALAKMQTSRNDWMARTARRLLQERAAAGPLDAETLGALRGLAASPEWHTSLRGLWTLHQTGNLTGEILGTALGHESDLVRAWAVQLAVDRPQPPLVPVKALTALAKDDPSATVRLALASALPDLPAPAAWDVAMALSRHAEDARDRFLPKMIWSGIAPLVSDDFSRALTLAEGTKLQPLADSVYWFAAMSWAGRESLFASLPDYAGGAAGGAAGRAIRLAAFALRAESSLPAPFPWPLVRWAAAHATDPAVRADADQLAAVFGDSAVLARMRETLADTAAPPAARQSAFRLLKRTGDAAALPVFVKLLDQPAFTSAVIPLLGRSGDPATAAALLQRFGSFAAGDRAAALASLSSRAALALPLLKAMEAGTFDKKQLTSLHIRQIRNLNDAACNQLLEKTWGRFNETPAGTKANMARIKKVFREAPLWAYEREKGRAVYERVCAACHTMDDGTTDKFGPNLSGSWRNGPDYFIENIVDPNAVIGEGFQLIIINLKDGTVLSGSVENETATTLTLRTLTGPVSIAVGDVKERQKLEQSLMPGGLLETLPEREMLELLKFLTTKP